MKNAHWCGQEGYKNNYVICESTFELDEDKCFNLVDNPEHLKLFEFTKKALIEQQIHNLIVPRVIEIFKAAKKLLNMKPLEQMVSIAKMKVELLL